MTGVLLRAPQPDECGQLAAIVDQAGGGVISFLLDGLIPAFSGQSLLAAALRRDQELYGRDSTLILEKHGHIAAMLTAGPAEEHVVHSALNLVAPAARIDAVRPMLEASAPGSLHIDIFWLHKDLGTEKDAQLLLRAACEKAGAMGRGSLGVFCRQNQQTDLDFFIGNGFVAHRQFPPQDFAPDGKPEGGALLLRQL